MLQHLSFLIRGVGEVPVEVVADSLEDVRVFLDKNGFVNARALKTGTEGVFYKSDIAVIMLRPEEKPQIVQARTPILMPVNNGRAQ